MSNPPTFKTLERQLHALAPSKTTTQFPKLAKLAAPHIDSFNSLFVSGSSPGLLDKAVGDIGSIAIFDGIRGETLLADRNKLELWLSSLTVGKPSVEGAKGILSTVIYPSECRERGVSYKAKMQIRINWRVNGGPIQSEIRSLGSLPVMVRSVKCNLDGKSPSEMVLRHEDSDEFGGYFVSNGIERLVRLLIVPRRNHPTAIIRPSFQNRGPTYSKFGVSIRSVRPDQTSQTITMHYCTDGAVTLRFSYKKSEYMVPAMMILRALCDASDLEVFERITMGVYTDTFLTDRVELLLRSFRRYSVYSRKQGLAYLGSKFAVMLDSPEDELEEDVGLDFLKRIFLVHLSDARSKFDLIIFMMQKLYSLVAGDSSPDNPDSLQFQETLLAGHLFSGIIKEKLTDWLVAIKAQVQTDIRRSPASVNFSDKKFIQKVFMKTSGVSDIGKKLEYFLATGNLISTSGLDLQQVSGYTIIAEKLNFYRYISHFRSIHRGSFFAELKTTTVRKLLPESWGFLCPVHTPDGSPCGLLNHLSHTCEILLETIDVSHIPGLVASLGAGQLSGLGPRARRHISSGVVPDTDIDSADDMESGSDEVIPDRDSSVDPNVEFANRERMIVSIQLDGKVIGWCAASVARQIAWTLRDWKVRKMHKVPLKLEIGFVPPTKGGQYPGLFLFSSPARMVRAVRYLATDGMDYVGPFEQVYMDIACMKEDVAPGITTHQEVNPTDMLSVVANLTPFSDFNQSPRNMYQCQMGKQSMGTPAQSLHHRTDNKLYRLQTGQSPIVRPNAHNDYGLDGYPNGMNAVVCVISYTGYDMEDASIISKSSHERGYGYGTVYKGEWVDLSSYHRHGEPVMHHFGFIAAGESEPNLSEKALTRALQFIDLDGLPIIGVRLTNGDPMYAFVDDVTGKVTIKEYKGMEDAYVDQVRLIGSDSGTHELQKIQIRLRIPRPPLIGDKFSSRHGQKGVISQKWPSIDMPFSESGIIPDVIINPHAFPSRMTIGMFVESLAGKAGALHGYAQDATPFKFNEDHAAGDFFGEELRQAGFNYHGNEPMYSGITGQEFKADIYIGVVYYQRLRHMVSDKYQVRTTGPVHNLTQQPVKGRKRAGGIRFGEMERDSLLAHGVSYLLKDRLMNCSDYSQCHVCSLCGSILGPMQRRVYSAGDAAESRHNATKGAEIAERVVECMTCETSRGIEVVAIPYVFRYLCTELVAMNVRLRLDIGHRS
ncbi:hypothetical protein BASA50_010979 [Batrachochytrium salamandrivorans]|uniref:DNA-directed RNA polymerase subunit beta n=1 Tax=Batrachochytrium salamandrivorans TaxID=1357716 RepID=A0ABQ8EX20_9FUNG|nr:hypothetical protein BASA62_008176 [Batrachochytrium salamandrivorans]KAH6567798.1 hypothetical protein BASA60_008888 [Batrachochytrium salamandrivorans]KAH6585446.1 hypothetical protein BASA61_006793 [Batrachochytrium salamandrivorans]KAH6587960.1 hypothetical protein BASA50_010979 [Batrachochytrium salamandrivorans]KAH9270508.1 hypothetical protein BASA83_007320 [Batrachochytrium salamandrivorans]